LEKAKTTIIQVKALFAAALWNSLIQAKIDNLNIFCVKISLILLRPILLEFLNQIMEKLSINAQKSKIFKSDLQK
jgi:hypothetical protein